MYSHLNWRTIMERNAAKEMLKKIEHEMSFPKAGETTSGVMLKYHGPLKEALSASLAREDAAAKSADASPKSKAPKSAEKQKE